MKESTFFLLSSYALLAMTHVASAGDASPILFAGYWSNFLDHWRGVFQRQNGIGMGILFIGLISLFIITRGKWRK